MADPTEKAGRASDRTSGIVKWIAAAATGAVLLAFCFVDVRWDAVPRRGIVGPYISLGGPVGPVGVHVQLDEGGSVAAEIALWEHHRFPSAGVIWMDMPLGPAGKATIHRPIGDWYVRTALWLRWLAYRAALR